MHQKFLSWLKQNPLATDQMARDKWFKLCDEQGYHFSLSYELDGKFLVQAQRSMNRYNFVVKQVV